MLGSKELSWTKIYMNIVNRREGRNVCQSPTFICCKVHYQCAPAIILEQIHSAASTILLWRLTHKISHENMSLDAASVDVVNMANNSRNKHVTMGRHINVAFASLRYATTRGRIIFRCGHEVLALFLMVVSSMNDAMAIFKHK